MIASADEFVRLRSSEKQEEYLRAAEEDAPLPVWIDVISQFPEMREWAAINKTIPIEILEILARDESDMVRATVANKRKLTSELFDLLARDHSELVRLRVAYNKKVSRTLLEKLAGDSSPLVSATAKERLGPQDE